MNLSELILSEGVFITEGSMGTYLGKLGYKGATPELAVLECPELVKRVHSEYIKAGAQIIITDTFGANIRRLAKKNLEEKLIEINKAAAGIAVKVRESCDNVLVAGDIGPTGELLEPYGALTKKAAADAFSLQADILQKSGVDFILLETFQDLEELKTAFYTIREKLDIPVLPCITLNPGEEYRTLMGQKIEDITAFAETEKAGVLGINCGVGSGEMLKVVRQVKEFSDIALWIKPNAGMPQVEDGKVVYPETPEEFAGNCVEMVKVGTRFIGGCCGTTPEYIKLLKEKIHENS